MIYQAIGTSFEFPNFVWVRILMNKNITLPNLSQKFSPIETIDVCVTCRTFLRFQYIVSLLNSKPWSVQRCWWRMLLTKTCSILMQRLTSTSLFERLWPSRFIVHESWTMTDFISIRFQIGIMKTFQISNSAIWRHISVKCFQSEGWSRSCSPPAKWNINNY